MLGGSWRNDLWSPGEEQHKRNVAFLKSKHIYATFLFFRLDM